MLRLAVRNLLRRPLRNGLAVAGLATAVATLAALSAFCHGYERALSVEVKRTGIQLMLVPLGCPYDAAARVLRGNTLENSLPAAALDAARQDPAVEVAAPLLMVTTPRPEAGRADIWVGVDETIRRLKPWWKAREGAHWFTDSNSVILGSEAAELEMRSPGDTFFSPETGMQLQVAGVLDRSGTSDDSLFFVPLATAQRMFTQPDRITAVALSLHDPEQLRDAISRLQQIPGAQVVTMTEMMGTFQNLLGAVRTLARAIALVAVVASVLGVFNTLLAAVVEQGRELAIMRALGASRAQIFSLLGMESLLLSGMGAALGVGLVAVTGPGLYQMARFLVPSAPRENLLWMTGSTVAQCVGVGLAVGVAASLYPAWRASRVMPAIALMES